MKASVPLLVVLSASFFLMLAGCGNPEPPAAEAPQVKPEPKPEPPPPEPIALAKVDPITLQPGAQAVIELQVERNGNEGPVEFTVGEADKGITIEAPTIPEEESKGSLTVKADQSLGDVQLSTSIQIAAAVGDQSASQTLVIEVPKLNLPSLQPMGAVLLQPGTSKTVDVKLSRNGFKGSVKLRVEGATEKVKCELANPTIEKDATTLQIVVAGDAPTADTKIRIATTLFGRNIGTELPLKVDRKPYQVKSFKVVTLRPGETQRVELPIERGSYKGPCRSPPMPFRRESRSRRSTWQPTKPVRCWNSRSPPMSRNASDRRR